MRKRMIAVPLAAALVITQVPQPASAVDEINTKKLRDAVTVSGILGHERVLQRIATQNGGTRASGTPGFAASAAYVTSVLKKAGYKVTEQKFTFPFYRELAPAQLAQVSPTPTTYETVTYDYSASGDVTGRVVPALNNVLPPTPTPSSTAGCTPADFAPASATAPEVALIQRGGCDFAVKAANAAAAGYDAAIIFNEGQPGRTDLFTGTLGGPGTIPVVGLSFADGSALAAQAAAGTVTVRVQTSTEVNAAAQTSNIIADSREGDPDKVLVVGAHLDSVVEGPGINDNGSGTAQNLEIAVQMAKLKIKPRQKVRFAFWGAEEAGLLGSEHYVANLSDAELTTIFANLNFDMVGSPNYVRFVYDGDGSDTGTSGPYGSDQIEGLFNKYFADQGLATDPTAFDGRSDYGPFILAGIPAGGLFSGAEGVKTPEQAAVYGGTAGAPYDACYHEACDDINNLNPKALAELGDAAAHAVLTLARTKTGFYPDGSLRAAARKAAATKQLPYKGGHLVR
ncbi:Zn-dependent M28 family amino/carboxypeptidase [Actinoplanes octamycinicus]|uniref:Zn-dependent M28 family amino/carboxypeptidase n=1 Tax=Actinoplanes octamycinicus TaxID=135948 RepID=A0A7W7H5Q5_9ACTN|nr:M28 family metallopeptidase [Actinoplanes octamycinicus]MBB4744383.1 Zn-dependent M28 family amino/carboxypeptidase [Actinoplanes octamycinicus]GIE56655.1 aminopeptidase [Actinoplanes octamycinicus]